MRLLWCECKDSVTGMWDIQFNAYSKRLVVEVFTQEYRLLVCRCLTWAERPEKSQITHGENRTHAADVVVQRTGHYTTDAASYCLQFYNCIQNGQYLNCNCNRLHAECLYGTFTTNGWMFTAFAGNRFRAHCTCKYALACTKTSICTTN